LAIEILNLLGKHAVEEKHLKSELIKTGKFSREETEDFLKEAVTQGIVYQGENGYYVHN
jgi:polyhydroxyalkanoate synthesis regulator phasin